MITKEIDHKLKDLFVESAMLAWEHLPEDSLRKCESPIEKLMLCALWSRGHWSNRLSMRVNNTFKTMREDPHGFSNIRCCPQVEVGSYRVDFLLVQQRSNGEPPCMVAIECDGHDFHEKTKAQAARDKSRDRELLADYGVQVFRFTGSEIWADVGMCADQVLNYLDLQFVDSAYRLELTMREHRPKVSVK